MSSPLLAMVVEVTESEIKLALPFGIAAVLVLANSFVQKNVQGRADDEINALISRIESVAGTSLGGDPGVSTANFKGTAAWMADAGSGLATIAGTLAAVILLIRDAGEDSAMLYVGIVAVLAVVIALALVLTAKPREYGTPFLSRFQKALLGVNVGLAVAILLLNTTS